MSQAVHGSVHGLHAPAARLTPLGAAILAGLIALPGGLIIWLIGLALAF